MSRGGSETKNRSWLARATAGALMAAAIHLLPKVAVAAGALAVATSGDVAKDGIAMAGAVNKPSTDEAMTEALKLCRDYRPSSGGWDEAKMAKACRIVVTFNRGCYATAFDPEVGTPGAGWSVGRDKATAELRALNVCRAAAGESRRTFCTINVVDCDDHD